jgi:phage terminase small subunit
MPILSNARHEKFALNILKGQSGREAYLNAGYRCGAAAADVSASELLRV